MKFKAGEYFKFPGHCCQFIQVVDVLKDDGKSAELKVKWAIQEFDNWWRKGQEENINITEHRYPHWRPYTPWGIQT